MSLVVDVAAGGGLLGRGDADVEQQSGSARLRLVVVDDHEFARESVAAALDAEPGLETVGQAGTIAAALEVIDELGPDVVVLDLNLPDGSGRDLIEACVGRVPTEFVVYTSTLAQLEADELKQLGAAEVLLKSLRGGGLVDAIRRVGSALLQSRSADDWTPT